MAAGQLVLALAADVPTAVAARVLVGAGDAMTFISVLRLVSLWFPGRHGAAGHPADRHPRPGRLRSSRPIRWSPCCTAPPGRRPSSVPPPIGVLVGVLVLRRPARRPGGTVTAARRPGWREVRRSLVDTWREPGTRLGLLHPPGHPVLRHRLRAAVGLPVPRRRPGAAHRRRRPACSPCWSSSAWASARCWAGSCGRWPLRRSDAGASRSSAPRSPPGPSSCCGRAGRRCRCSSCSSSCSAPTGPGSMIGFDYARTENPAERHGQRQRGGQRRRLRRLAAHHPGRRRRAGPAHARARRPRTRLDAFRAAFAVQYLFWASAWSACSGTGALVRARLARDGVVLAPLHAAVAARMRGGSAYR